METAQRMVDEAAKEWAKGTEIFTMDPETGEAVLKFYLSRSSYLRAQKRKMLSRLR